MSVLEPSAVLMGLPDTLRDLARARGMNTGAFFLSLADPGGARELGARLARGL